LYSRHRRLSPITFEVNFEMDMVICLLHGAVPVVCEEAPAIKDGGLTQRQGQAPSLSASGETATW
jgi:hypothetical protein